MTKVTAELCISADGFSAGRNQTEERPFGEDAGNGFGNRLHDWRFTGDEEGRALMDRFSANKAYILGRNMFGPVRGEWDRDWNGWWGDDPPYHKPVFVLTHYPRDPQPMQGGTTFYFVTDGIESALQHARDVPGDGNIAVMGGATTINQYLAAGLIDELRLHIAPFTMGAGTRIFDGVPPLNLQQIESSTSSSITHVTYRMLL
ncbi:MAG: dihydrofolate reductase family protein [Thermomicrobiales bacterium]|nr:dihydrofolate reductase family protein [Thermomicrobiales bacterium]